MSASLGLASTWIGEGALARLLGMFAVAGLAVALAGLGLLLVLQLGAHRPAAREAAERLDRRSADTGAVPHDREAGVYRLFNWNIGYAGLGAARDFFLDGGREVTPPYAASLASLAAIVERIAAEAPDFVFLQEIDRSAKRSHGIDQRQVLLRRLGGAASYAANFRVRYVPWPPRDPVGSVDSGLLTWAAEPPQQAERLALDNDTCWPKRLVLLQRCLLLSRHLLPDGRSLVLINLHLEAFDADSAARQSEALYAALEELREAGIPTIAGGDWNRPLPRAAEEDWAGRHWAAEGEARPLNPAELPAGYRLVHDPRRPSNRHMARPYRGHEAQTALSLIDGFVVSDEIEVLDIETLDLDFADSDHQPQRLIFRVGPSR